MVTNLVTAQVVRYVTDRVIENLSRQAGRSVGDGGASGSTDLADMAMSAQLNRRIGDLNESLDEVNERMARLEGRLGEIEAKTGWKYTLRLTVGIVIGIGVGFGGASFGHLVGWIH